MFLKRSFRQTVVMIVSEVGCSFIMAHVFIVKPFGCVECIPKCIFLKYRTIIQQNYIMWNDMSSKKKRHYIYLKIFYFHFKEYKQDMANSSC